MLIILICEMVHFIIDIGAFIGAIHCKQTFIRMQENFLSFVRASSLRIFLTANWS